MQHKSKAKLVPQGLGNLFQLNTIILMSDFRLIIGKHACHSLKNFGHGTKSVAYSFEVEKSVK